jgi:hypothetical protein
MVMKSCLILLLFITGIGQCFGQDSIPYPMDSNTCIHGKVFSYYTNGKPKSFKTYEHGFLYGPYAKYYRNGQIKEKGFLDDVNEWTLLFQPSKVIQEEYRKNGEIKKSLEGEKQPLNQVPSGKCQCADGNVKRIRSLLLGHWVKEKMIPFDKSDKIIDSVYNKYDTEISFFPNNRLSVSINGIKYDGRYLLTSNTLILEMTKDSAKWESLIYLRWPKETLYPNSTQEHFDLKLVALLNVSNMNNEVNLSNVVVKFKKE